MNRIFTAVAVALNLFITWSCAPRLTEIPANLDKLSTALNNVDQAAFKSLIWYAASEYTDIRRDAITVSNLVFTNGFQYKYYFSNYAVPTTGNSPLVVTVDCTVECYSGDNLLSRQVYPASPFAGSGASFEFANASTTFFLEDWKFSKIYLPNYVDPVLQSPYSGRPTRP